MDNKKFVQKNQKIKMSLLTLLNIVPDEFYIRCVYFLFFGRFPDLESPRTFNEKINWLKLNYRDPIMGKLVDKYEARNYVRKRIGSDVLIELLQVCNSFDEIDFDSLPKSFVIKTTHASGFNIICKDKDSLDMGMVERKFRRWMCFDYSILLREWAYGRVKPRILVERFIENPDGKPPEDYKFFCFNGKVGIIQVDKDRFGKHKRDLYDSDWNRIDTKLTFKNTDKGIKRPLMLDKMIDTAQMLSGGFPFVRVDLYTVGEKIYFGEMTFYPGGGMEKFSSYDFDVRLGRMMDIHSYSASSRVSSYFAGIDG